MHRIQLLLLLSLVLSCTSWDTNQARPARVEEHEPLGFVVSDLTALWWDDLPAKKERRVLREQERSIGKRVCEEGEWPQRWVEDNCRVCGCDEGDVRWCTLKRCWDREAATRKMQELR